MEITKALSIKQPWAHLIAAGIKDIENRTWQTHFRGRIYIHASAKLANYNLTDDQYKDSGFFALVEGDKIKSAIIGEVDIIDCVINHDSVWAEHAPKATKCPECNCSDYINKNLIGEGFRQCKNCHQEWWIDIAYGKPIWNWVLANPVLYDKPILNVKGKLSFWEFRDLIECRCCTNKETDEEMNICERCEQEYCIDCQAPYNQFSQIDYNCCTDCYNRDNRD